MSTMAKMRFVFPFFVLGIFQMCGLYWRQPLKLTVCWKEPFYMQFLFGGYTTSSQQECFTSQICALLWPNSFLVVLWTRKRLVAMITESLIQRVPYTSSENSLTQKWVFVSRITKNSKNSSTFTEKRYPIHSLFSRDMGALIERQEVDGGNLLTAVF